MDGRTTLGMACGVFNKVVAMDHNAGAAVFGCFRDSFRKVLDWTKPESLRDPTVLTVMLDLQSIHIKHMQSGMGLSDYLPETIAGLLKTSPTVSDKMNLSMGLGSCWLNAGDSFSSGAFIMILSSEISRHACAISIDNGKITLYTPATSAVPAAEKTLPSVKEGWSFLEPRLKKFDAVRFYKPY